ncbi:MAG: spermidine/putrescine ABC transporter [Rhodobacteraceae bacterium]|jgi:spermidine/putrescine transport system permease protein|nr:MAG: spermidine/putrescine ABC transporter [Paracoccaceae bacterium]|tara:strand:- start:3268 stop:4125 length:858 start_codon:yes stop_codon:yes gene_type:complete
MNFSDQDKKGWRLLGLPFIFSVLLLAVPLATMFALSFWTQDYLVLKKTFTLANYKEAWFEPVYQKLFNRSLIISMTVTFLTISFAFPVAYFISFYGGRRKALWLFFITIPFWTSYLLRMFLWKVILGYNGVLNSFFKWLGIITEPLTFLLYNSNAVIIALTHGWAPFAILPIFVSLEKIDRSLLEASKDLGDSSFQQFFRIILPLSIPGLIGATLIIFIPTIGDYITPKLVGGPDGLMIANMIQVQFSKANNAPLSAALSVSSLLIVGLISIIFVFLNKKHLRTF